MTYRPQADNLQSTFVVMNPSQEAKRLPVTDTAWQELDERFDNAEPASMLFVTPGEGTEIRESPPG